MCNDLHICRSIPFPWVLFRRQKRQVESTIFIVNTYVNVAFLRLLLSVVQLAKTDQHLEEELMFCAQANPLSQ